MNDLKDQNAILTGASGGLGVFIAEALAREGVNLFLVAYPGDGLAALAESLSRHRVHAVSMALDLRDPGDRKTLVERAQGEFRRIDILVNNAGVEFNGSYHELSEEKITEVLSVNLIAPMLLTHAVLPAMLQRKHGHIVNISSLAGKSGPAFQEPYAATKAALAAFTSCLRATYAGTGVSASVICPGFIETGIYSRLKARSGCDAPALLGACTPQRVASAVVRSIRCDRPEIIINRFPVRPLLAIAALSPTLGAWIIRKIGVHEFFRRAVEREARDRTLREASPMPMTAERPN